MFDEERLNRVKRALLCMQRYSWEQGVAAQAFLESGDTDIAVLMAREAVVRQTEDGRLAVMGYNNAVTDPAAIGEAMLYAAKVTGDRSIEDAARKMADYLLFKAPKTKDGTLYHIDDRRQVWVDSFYMAPPFLAAAGYADEALKQVEGFRRLLWNEEKKLFSHIWDDEKGEFERRDFWGVGNGWAAAGMTRIIGSLSVGTISAGGRTIDSAKDNGVLVAGGSGAGPAKQRLVLYVKNVLDGCLEYMRDDGLFHDKVDNPVSFVETNLSQMLAYSIYRGVKGGWLAESYLVHAERMRNAVYNMVDGSGLVHGVCGAPCFNSPGTAPEGQSFFILMEAAASNLLT